MPQETRIFRSLFIIIDFLSVSPGMLVFHHQPVFPAADTSSLQNWGCGIDGIMDAV